MAKKDKAEKDPDAAREVKAPGDMWWWICLLVGLAGMVTLYLSGGGFMFLGPI